MFERYLYRALEGAIEHVLINIQQSNIQEKLAAELQLVDKMNTFKASSEEKRVGKVVRFYCITKEDVRVQRKGQSSFGALVQASRRRQKVEN